MFLWHSSINSLYQASKRTEVEVRTSTSCTKYMDLNLRTSMTKSANRLHNLKSQATLRPARHLHTIDDRSAGLILDRHVGSHSFISLRNNSYGIYMRSAATPQYSFFFSLWNWPTTYNQRRSQELCSLVIYCCWWNLSSFVTSSIVILFLGPLRLSASNKKSLCEQMLFVLKISAEASEYLFAFFTYLHGVKHRTSLHATSDENGGLQFGKMLQLRW